MGQRKLPIGDLVPSGINGLLIFCEGRACGHFAEIDLADATERWGLNMRLDDIKGVCSVCDSRAIDVRPRWPAVGPGGRPDA